MHAAMWMNFECTILSQISQSRKDKCYRFHLYEIHRDRKYTRGYQGLGMGAEFLFGVIKSLWE